MRRVLLVVALLLAAPLARAESERWGAVELRVTGYRPNPDSEFKGRTTCGTSPSCTPFGDAFGNDRNLMFQIGVAKSLFTGFGTLDVGLGAGFWDKGGYALQLGSATHSRDEISFKIIPLSVSLTYRFDWLVETYGIPVAPYLRASLLRYQWWLTNPNGTSNFNGRSGSGGTNGYSFTFGFAFLLDILDPTLARDADNDTGINHTYIFGDVTKTYLNNFGSSKSWDLSDPQPVWSAGILFVF